MARAVGMIWGSNSIMLGGGPCPKPIASFDELALKDELRELVGKAIGKTINVLFDKKRHIERGATSAASPPRRARSR